MSGPSPQDHPRADAAERRAWPRQGCGPWAVLRVLAGPGLWPFAAYPRDVSRQGLGFLNDFLLRVGAVLVVPLVAGSGRAFHIRAARVVHVTLVDGQWLVGRPVSSPFSATELAALG